MANRIKAFFIVVFIIFGICFFSNQQSNIVTGTISVRVSNYWPPSGGINCYHDPETGLCVTTTADGSQWNQWIGKGAACPASWDFGTRFRTPDGRIWECKDRGEMIVYGSDNIPWIDLLEENSTYNYGDIIEIEFLNN